tara:strand:+ start:1478 stop:2503 length:1026 start_codon:yes stop_codon:yes gene_type:complete
MDTVKEYYGKVLKKTTDLKTNACCTNFKYPKYITDKMKNIHDDILSTYYGCGLIIPDCLLGSNIIDLGCGTGRDVYLLSQFVGENGNVIGVDMTESQINKAIEYKKYHMNVNNYSKTNVEFKQGYIESLNELNFKNNYYDIIVSNCVVNLSPNKEQVFKQVYDLLKEGGEFYFSDVYSSVRIPDELKNDNILWGECLSGALYWNDFLNIAKKVGFSDPRLVDSNKITIQNKDIENKIGHIDFYSATYRLFKIKDLESDCEDYGQAVIYKGTIENHSNCWSLDNHHTMMTNKIFPVCGNTYNILYHSRFNQHFEFIGNFEQHYGIFDNCGKKIPFVNNNSCC